MDIERLLLFQYPIRCRRCNRRDYVSLHRAVAAIGQDSRQLRAVRWLARSFELIHHNADGNAMASRSIGVIRFVCHIPDIAERDR